jgi:hypothetical protein
MQNKKYIKLEDIFPEGCEIRLNPFATEYSFSILQDNKDSGQGVEYMCYTCDTQNCEVRKVKRGDEANRYFIEPIREVIVEEIVGIPWVKI